jgi:RNase P subunit RPR2
MRKRIIFGRNKLNKPYKRVRCPFCKHTFAPETIQIVGITEEQTNFVILLCPSAKCRTILEIIPQYNIGINK